MTTSPLNVGPLEALLADAQVTAIHVDETTIRYEKLSATHVSPLRFESHDQRRAVIDGIVRAGGETLSGETPVVDCVLSDGTRVRAEYDPLRLSLHKRQ